MKKFLALLLSLVSAFCLVACSSSSDGSSNGESGNSDAIFDVEYVKTTLPVVTVDIEKLKTVSVLSDMSSGFSANLYIEGSNSEKSVNLNIQFNAISSAIYTNVFYVEGTIEGTNNGKTYDERFAYDGEYSYADFTDNGVNKKTKKLMTTEEVMYNISFGYLSDLDYTFLSVFDLLNDSSVQRTISTAQNEQYTNLKIECSASGASENKSMCAIYVYDVDKNIQAFKITEASTSTINNSTLEYTFTMQKWTGKVNIPTNTDDYKEV